MIDIIQTIKNRIEWIEKEEGNLTEHEKELLTQNLKRVDDELARCMLLHMAVSRQ